MFLVKITSFLLDWFESHLSFSLSPSHAHSLTLTHTHTHTHISPLAHTHTKLNILALFHTHSQSLILAHQHNHTHRHHTLSHFLSSSWLRLRCSQIGGCLRETERGREGERVCEFSRECVKMCERSFQEFSRNFFLYLLHCAQDPLPLHQDYISNVYSSLQFCFKCGRAKVLCLKHI